MRPVEFSIDPLVELFYQKTIATMKEMIHALGGASRRTVFRKLKKLPYITSYSHRGGYYSLNTIAQFDELGIWCHDDVCFSSYGTLVLTVENIVENSEHGHYVDELDTVLRVGTKDTLRRLVYDARIFRQRLAGQFLYCSADAQRQRQQLLARRLLLGEPGPTGPIPGQDILSNELRAAIVLFFSLLDEKQRRLYAGLEALKTGRGGDVRIAELLGIDRKTVARGREELLAQDALTDRTRRHGGGRKSVEKKRQK
jgi:hypothetical protein